MKNLNTFLNAFRDGFQFNNRFACRIRTPQVLWNTSTTSEQVAINWLERGFVCEATNLPDRAFAETEMTQYGVTEQFPTHTQFTSLDCVFNTPLVAISDEKVDNPIPRVFHAWQNLIQDMSGTYGQSSRDFTFSGTGSDNGYYGEIQLGVLDRTDNHLTLAYEFERVYPRVVQSTPVTWKEENELTKLSVGFTFSVWHPIPFVNSNDDFFINADDRTPRGAAFQNIKFIPPRMTIGSVLGQVASDVISRVTNGRVF